VKGDNIWISNCYGGDKCYIGVIMYRPYGKYDPPYKEYFHEFHKLMESFDGRPHWGKIHPWKYEDCIKSYPMWENFCKLREKLDPDNILSNEYTKKVFKKE